MVNLTADEAHKHPQSNLITRYIGSQSDVEVDIFSEQVEEDYTLVLCTDGLSALVSDNELREIVQHSGPQESAHHLAERAN